MIGFLKSLVFKYFINHAKISLIQTDVHIYVNTRWGWENKKENDEKHSVTHICVEGSLSASFNEVRVVFVWLIDASIRSTLSLFNVELKEYEIDAKTFLSRFNLLETKKKAIQKLRENAASFKLTVDNRSQPVLFRHLLQNEMKEVKAVMSESINYLWMNVKVGGKWDTQVIQSVPDVFQYKRFQSLCLIQWRYLQELQPFLLL
ncbi:CLUMA_CG014705, isoform A [Clunio marinus]|uniref:CLUMA_CG014705, isoform A n=1 Tax=Clunio marinus TaxID=568069 RepID=A0A1J1IS45_9DIPT|nr:CLUMA_CG014705, isoform A [Clunio marinus]